MDLNLINAYLERAREIIGDRSQGEITDDNAVVANLKQGMDIKGAVRSANQQYPDEALKPSAEDWGDLQARYAYIANTTPFSPNWESRNEPLVIFPRTGVTDRPKSARKTGLRGIV